MYHNKERTMKNFFSDNFLFEKKYVKRNGLPYSVQFSSTESQNLFSSTQFCILLQVSEPPEIISDKWISVSSLKPHLLKCTNLSFS